MRPLPARRPSRLHQAAGFLHDAVGQPFRWLILRSPLRHWFQKTDPNAWSLLRLPLAIFIALLLANDQTAFALVVFLFALSTDRLDGELARILGKTSQLGERIDTAVDAAMMAAVLLGLRSHVHELRFAAQTVRLSDLYVGLEIIRLCGGFWLDSLSQTERERIALRPNLAGNYKMATVGSAIITVLLGQPMISLWLFFLALLTGTLSLVQHIIDWLNAKHHRSTP